MNAHIPINSSPLHLRASLRAFGPSPCAFFDSILHNHLPSPTPPPLPPTIPRLCTVPNLSSHSLSLSASYSSSQPPLSSPPSTMGTSSSLPTYMLVPSTEIQHLSPHPDLGMALYPRRTFGHPPPCISKGPHPFLNSPKEATETALLLVSPQYTSSPPPIPFQQSVLLSLISLPPTPIPFYPAQPRWLPLQSLFPPSPL
ncbi:hypothetical protein AMTR_s00119p00091540, partial [Amborella trichopoda]